MAPPRKRRPTATSSFGVSRREGHDASGFYDRFEPPVISDDDTIGAPSLLDEIVVGDARDMSKVPDNSVALVVTSPPYYAGKQYEEDMTRGEVPSSYVEYLAMLRDVFAECLRVLEPGGRIAVNVANLGRRPYLSLSSDVAGILGRDLRMLLRGEIIWVKARAAGGNCAWGSFQLPGNPVLRDVSERIIVASKGRFDRAVTAKHRERDGLPSVSTIWRDEFMDLTTVVWEFPPESATRIGHPAPFPVELPARCIQLYTYEGDVVLDPFLGSGSTAVAAVRSGRRYVGYDLDGVYVDAALERVATERALLDIVGHREREAVRPRRSPSTRKDPDATGDLLDEATRTGLTASDLATSVITAAGFTQVTQGVRLRCGVAPWRTALDTAGRRWVFLLAGSFTGPRSGLARTDIVFSTIGEAATIHGWRRAAGARAATADSPSDTDRVVVLTTNLPDQPKLRNALAAVVGSDAPIFDVIDLTDRDDHVRLEGLAGSTPTGSRSTKKAGRGRSST